MRKYLFEFTDAEGRHGHDFIEAMSVEEANRLIETTAAARRYRSATLLDNDLLAQLRTQRQPSGLDSKTLSRVEALARRGGGHWPMFVESLRANRWFLLVCCAMVAIGVATARWWPVAAGGGAFLVYLALFLRARQQAAIYTKLLRAAAFGQWDEVLRLADLRQGAVAGSENSAFDLDMRRAAAFAATGRMDEAMVVARRWEAKNVQPSGLYWGRLATVYARAGDYARFVEFMRRSFTESGGAVWARIDLALAIARVGEDPQEALTLLEHESIPAQPETSARFVHWARGMAMMRLGDFQGAELALAQTVDSFTAQAANPVVWTSLALAAGALAVAGCVNGKKDRALALLTPLLPIFNANADPALAALVGRQVLGND